MMLSHTKRSLVILLDLIAVLGGFTAAFLLRFEFALDPQIRDLLVLSLPLPVFGYFLPFWYFRLYTGIWRYSSFPDLVRIIEAIACGFVLTSSLILFLHHGDYPRSVLLISPALIFLGICGVRFAIRFGKEYLSASGNPYLDRSALIVGAGDMGEGLLRQMLKSAGGHRVVGFLDDDPSKWNMTIHDVPILGGIKALSAALARYKIDEVIIAINSRRGDIVRSVAEALRTASSKAELKIAPSLDEMLQNPGPITVRNVRPADLLSREVVRLDEPLIARFLTGKVVLVTGAGGTIGSELCRQALRYGPSKLILLDNHATSLFYGELGLRDKSKNTAIVPVLGNTLNRVLIERLFEEHKPQVILHAAAHKHQPQLENNIQEAVENNFLATYQLAETAHVHQAECFLLISTDKAVRPSSVMGATKRAAEMAVQSFAHRSKTRFMAVRFGNVLGSSGSVLRIFEEQIKQGGPLTLTHPDMKRYFMTVEEAVQLILQACAIARGGEIFILKMGEPVRILDMAKNLILLSGLQPEKDIRIQYTGMRPGEKLTEELSEDSEDIADSAHPQILLLKNSSVDPKAVDKCAKELHSICQNGNPQAALHKLKELVPSFSSQK